MIDDVTVTYLLDWAKNNGIKYSLCTTLTPYTPSCSKPERNKMVINLNWHDPAELPFQVAHEIGHILNKDKGKVFYCLVNTTDPVENNANHVGLKMLIDFYFKDIPREQWNLTNFINYYHIPSELEDWCGEYLKTLK